MPEDEATGVASGIDEKEEDGEGGGEAEEEGVAIGPETRCAAFGEEAGEGPEHGDEEHPQAALAEEEREGIPSAGMGSGVALEFHERGQTEEGDDDERDLGEGDGGDGAGGQGNLGFKI